MITGSKKLFFCLSLCGDGGKKVLSFVSQCETFFLLPATHYRLLLLLLLLIMTMMSFTFTPGWTDQDLIQREGERELYSLPASCDNLIIVRHLFNWPHAGKLRMRWRKRRRRRMIELRRAGWSRGREQEGQQLALKKELVFCLPPSFPIDSWQNELLSRRRWKRERILSLFSSPNQKKRTDKQTGKAAIWI